MGTGRVPGHIIMVTMRVPGIIWEPEGSTGSLAPQGGPGSYGHGEESKGSDSHWKETRPHTGTERVPGNIRAPEDSQAHMGTGR